MHKLRIYRHPDCQKCREISSLHQKLDWLHRLEFSTETPSCGPLQMGEIAVEKIGAGQFFKGASAVRLIFSQVPAYISLYPLLWLPPVAQRIDRDLSGCDGNACAVAARPNHEVST